MHRHVSLLLFAFFIACSLPSVGRVSALPPDFYYVQPGRVKPVRLDPHVLVFFLHAPGEAHPPPRREQIAAALPSARLADGLRGNAVLASDANWRAGDLDGICTHLQRVGLFAYAVFCQGPAGGPAMFLTGRIIVRFRTGQDRSQSPSWAAQRGLVYLRTLSGGYCVFWGGVGYRSLVEANRLNSEREVEWAAPDWARALALRLR